MCNNVKWLFVQFIKKGIQFMFKQFINVWRKIHVIGNDYVSTVKHVNKGHPLYGLNMVFIYKWSLFRGFFGLFYQGRVINVWPLCRGGLYLEVVCNTCLSVLWNTVIVQEKSPSGALWNLIYKGQVCYTSF